MSIDTAPLTPETPKLKSRIHKSSGPTKTKMKLGKRLLLAGLTILILLALILIGLRIFITTQSGARLIENQVNSRSFGPIESVEISGLSGDPLGEFTLGVLKVKDKDGVWAEVENISMDWNAFALLKRHIDIQNIELGSVALPRKPVLNPSSDEPLISPKISLAKLSAPQINLGESLVGRDISLAASGRFLSESSGQITSLLSVNSTEMDGDKLLLDVTRNPSGELSGTFEIGGAPDGAIAALIKAPSAQTIAGSGQILGTTTLGEGKFDLSFGDIKATEISSNWTANALSLTIRTDLTAWPILQPIAERLGQNAAVTARLERDDNEGLNEQAFTANLGSDIVTAKISGTVPEAGGLPERLQIQINIAQTSRMAELPDGYGIGNSSVNGTLTLPPNLAFKGITRVQNVKTPFGVVGELSGPVMVSQSADDRINASVDISAKAIKLTDLDGFLAPTARLNVKASYNPETQSVNLPILDFSSGSQNLSVTGSLTSDLNLIDISGKTKLTIPPDIELTSAILGGTLESEFSIDKTRASSIALSSEGRYGIDEVNDGPLQDLVGQELLYSVAMSRIDGGINVDKFRVENAGIISEISGVLGDTFDLSGEARTRRPVNLANVIIAPETRLSFELTGPPDTPFFRVDANSDSISLNDREFKFFRLRAELSDLIANPNGPVQIDAQTEFGDLSASADLAAGDVRSAKNIEAAIGGLLASGDIELDANNLLTGAIDLNLAADGTRAVTGKLNLLPEGQEQTVTFALDASDVAYEKIAFETLKINAEGTLSNLTADIDTAGTYDPSGTPQGFGLKTDVKTTRSADNAIALSATPTASWNDIVINARAPITMESQSGKIKLEAPLSLDQNNIDISYSLEDGQERLSAEAVDIPTNVLALPGPLVDSLGSFTVSINAGHDGTSPSGTSTLSLTDWRGFDVAKGQGLTTEYKLKLGAVGSSSWALSGSSVQGFNLRGDGVFPLHSGASLAQTRLNLDAPLTGQIEANGPAINIIGLLSPNADEIKGSLDLALDLSGSISKPMLSGQVQGQGLTFEVPEIGTQIKQGRFTLGYTNDTIKLTDLSVNDPGGGSLTAQGDFQLGEFGRPIGSGQVKVTNFTAVDRRDVTAVLGGDLTFESSAETSALSGDLLIEKVNIRQFVSGAASVIDIETEEINRPPELAPLVQKPPTNPLTLDVKIRAPRNILINSNGIDLEMSVDASVKGTAAAPEFFGTATVVRGGYKLAGQRLDFESGTIEFDGPLQTAALNLVAQTETQNLTATVTIGGTVEAPEITLSSDPERPEDEVLSALLFGRSATELSALETIQLAGTLAQFSGVGGGFDLLGGLRETLGISQLNVSTSNDGSTQVSGGRYIAKNVYLQLFSGNSFDQTSAVIDWTIKPNIALQSKILADNDQSLSLKWKKDF